MRACAPSLPTFKKSVQAQSLCQQTVAALHGRKNKAQGVVRPPLVLTRASIRGSGAAASIPGNRKSVQWDSISKLLCRRMRLYVLITGIVNEHKKLVHVVPDTAMQIGDSGMCGSLGLRYTDANVMTDWQSRTASRDLGGAFPPIIVASLDSRLMIAPIVDLLAQYFT